MRMPRSRFSAVCTVRLNMNSRTVRLWFCSPGVFSSFPRISATASSEDAPRPPAGFVVDTWQYVDDGSAIRKTWQYKPAVPEDAQAAMTAIIKRIAALVVAYDAIEDVKSMETINIESLLALADAKEVSPEDMAKLKEDIVLLKTDLEGKMDANWYQIWNGKLKGAIAEALQNMEEALRRSQAENEANPQDE